MAEIIINKETSPLREKHYRDLRRKFIARLSVTYIAPSLLLISFFIYQYVELTVESRRLHLISIAESQSRILDIFLKERVANLLNLIDGPFIRSEPDNQDMNFYLEQLNSTSSSFIDIGFFSSSAIQQNYAGPLTFLEKKDYSKQRWFLRLLEANKRYIITDIYLGLRNNPHFTIGVKKLIADSNFIILKSSLDPDKIYEYIRSMEKSMDVNISIVNRFGRYQLVQKKIGNFLDSCPIHPRNKSIKGIEETEVGNKSIVYAYSWLSGADWAVIVSMNEPGEVLSISNNYYNVILASILIITALIVIVIFRSKTMVKNDYEKDIVKSQLEHAAKLATVGELSAGIAHEIGNPLNIIANEVGIMQDFANPKFNAEKKITELQPYFDKIMKAVYRCKDINKKLMTFVRQDDIKLEKVNINDLIKDLTSGFFERELFVENIEIKLDLCIEMPAISVDANQIRQVLINLINNASDAISGSGTITIATLLKPAHIEILVSDTGCGIEQDKINKIFMPFFTTKPVGKGTGLGLSVSFGIIKNHGGTIRAESILGKGTTFIIELNLGH